MKTVLADFNWEWVWKHCIWSVTYSSKQPIFYAFQIRIGMKFLFWWDKLTWSYKIKSPLLFKDQFWGEVLRKASLSRSEPRAIEQNMQGVISFILMVFSVLSSSLTDANELQSNTSTSKCKVGTKWMRKYHRVEIKVVVVVVSFKDKLHIFVIGRLWGPYSEKPYF